MKEQSLVSKNTVAQYKPTKSPCNESEIGNVLNREFTQEQELRVVVSDLTYVRLDQRWHYICILVDLYHREIISYSAGPNKTAALVQVVTLKVRVFIMQLIGWSESGIQLDSSQSIFFFNVLSH